MPDPFKKNSSQPNHPSLIDVPLFPLPGVVLFPGTVLPLRVFEPRYRRLLRDVLASEKLIGMAQLKPEPGEIAGAPAVFDVVGVGRVVAHRELADGTSQIALLGQGRGRITIEIARAPYRIGRLESLPDRMPDEAGEMLAAFTGMMETAQALISRTLRDEACDELQKALKERAEAGAITDLLASVYVDDSALRQVLMENSDVLARTRILQAIMERLLIKVEPRTDYGETICLN